MKIYIKKTAKANFELLETPDKELGKGGQARVFNIQTKGYENYCLKKFIREEDARKNYDRIAYMIQNPPKNIMGNSSFRICWPTAFAYDMQQNFIGYVMPLAFPNSRDLKILEVYNAKPISQQAKYKKYPDWFDKYELDSNIGLKNRMKMLCNWAIAIYSLHETHKYVVVDLKPENVMATSSGKISIVDTDSFQISENGKILYPGAAYTPAYFPPEGKYIQQSKQPFPMSCDCFAAAVCFYKILTGVHPYGGTIKLSPYNQLETEEEFINAGLFAFGDKKQYLRFNHDFNLHQNFDNLSPTIQQLFIRSFGQDPNKRPTMEEWGKALHESATSNISLIRSVVKPTKTNRLTIQIKDVKFKDEDFDGNIIRDSGSRLYSDVEYLAPQITYQVLQTGAPIDIWYKIYSPNGSLIYGNDSKAGFTWKGTVRCDAMTTFTVTLGGFGNTNKNCYEQTGTWRIEFYEGDKCLYKTTFEIYPKTTYTPPIKRTPTPTPPIKPIRTSSWDKFKDVIEDIGDWFEDDSPEFIGPLLHVISLIVYITYIVMAWNDNGFLGALLTGVIGMFLLGIAYYVNVVLAKIVQWVFRFIFYNVWTLIASLIIGLLCLLVPSVLNIVDNSSRDKVEATPVEQVVQTTTYYCISKSGLKVRNAPSTSAPQLGSLVYGEAVEVIQIVGEFAKIKYEQAEKEYAWVSRNYISRTMPSQPATPKANAISITSVKFANSDYNGYNMTNYGVQLYSDLQYLTPRVTIKPLSAEKKCELQMKIFCPDQSLMTGATSPEGYTYSKEVTIYKNNPVIRLPGWGSKSGDLYTPGTYRFEIWCDGDKLYTTNIDIKSRE